MLALCQHKDTLKDLAFEYLSLEVPRKTYRRSGVARDRLDRCEYLDAGMPIFDGPDQDKPWVEEMYRYVHWR